MGFAYAQGIIEKLKEKNKNLKLGRYYIIAPENAGSGTVDVTKFDQVWQYGSNERKLRNKPWLQDGVAPQTAVIGLGKIQKQAVEPIFPTPNRKGLWKVIMLKIICGYLKNLLYYDKGYVKPR